MKSARILTLACVLGAATPAFAQFYNFEDLPSLYWSDSYGASIGGQTDIGGYYAPGLTFGAGVQGIHTSSGYPAASPTIEVWDSNISNPTIGFQTGFAATQVSFGTAPCMVSPPMRMIPMAILSPRLRKLPTSIPWVRSVLPALRH